MPRIYTRRPVAERFWEKTDRRRRHECWPWLAFVTAQGYGQFQLAKNHPILAHRMAWELERGPIPAGLHLDHICRRRWCCNPWHTEPVEPGENTRRGIRGRQISQGARARTHCGRGHELALVGFYQYGNKKVCKKCGAENQRRRRSA